MSQLGQRVLLLWLCVNADNWAKHVMTGKSEELGKAGHTFGSTVGQALSCLNSTPVNLLFYHRR